METYHGDIVTGQHACKQTNTRPRIGGQSTGKIGEQRPSYTLDIWDVPRCQRVLISAQAMGHLKKFANTEKADTEYHIPGKNNRNIALPIEN